MVRGTTMKIERTKNESREKTRRGRQRRETTEVNRQDFRESIILKGERGIMGTKKRANKIQAKRKGTQEKCEK